MAADDTTQSTSIVGILGTFGDMMPKDQSGVGKQPGVSISQSPFTFPGFQAPLLPRTTNPFHYYQYADTSSLMIGHHAGPGSTNFIAAGMQIADEPMAGISVGGTTSMFDQRFGAIGSINPIDVPYQYGVGPLPPKNHNKDGAPGEINNDSKPFTVRQDILNHRKYFGLGPDERNVKWQEKSDVMSPDSAFGSIPGIGMIQGLPGMIMSLASSFKGLSNQQKQQIKSNTSSEMYSLIETTLNSAVDVGTYQTASLNSRVDEQTFADNMVLMLSSVSTNQDLVDVMHELRTNTALHGKDKLPTVEYRVPGAFGETGIIIDGHGNFKQNISQQVADAYANFKQFITQDIDDVEITCEFEGKIENKTLTVNRMDFGHLQKGSTYYIEGLNVTDNTHIVSFGTKANGNTGTYILNQSSNTVANNVMVMYKIISTAEQKQQNQQQQQQQQQGGGGGGLGGLIGMGFANIFGDSAQLLGRMMQSHDPVAASRILGNLGAVQKQALKRVTWLKGLAKQHGLPI